jgi:peptidyl-prolyl cis-trans isomerase D
VIAPHLPSVADKRAELTQAWTSDQLIKALRAKADALMTQARKDGTLDKAAASAGAKVTHEAAMQRIKAQQYQALGREFLGQAFAAKPGEVFAAGGKGGVYIARVDQVRPGDTAQTAQVTAAIRGRVSQAYAGDLLNSMQAAARDMFKPNINLGLARRTINVDPGLGGAGAKPAAGKAK